MARPPRKSFAERLQSVIDRHAGGVVRRFAQAIGVNHQAVHNWQAETSLPGAKALVALWNVYRVDPLWLLTGEQRIAGSVVLQVAPPVTDGDEIEPERFVTLPVLAPDRAARRPPEVTGRDIADYAVVYADWAPQPEQITCVRAPDDQLAPVIPKGSIAAIDHRQRDPKKLHGKIVALRKNGGVTLARCHVAAPDLVLGLPENPARRGARTITLRDDQIAADLIGRVVWWLAAPGK